MKPEVKMQLDRSLRLQQHYNLVVVLETVAFLVAAIYLLAIFEPASVAALSDKRKSQTLFMAWLAREQVSWFTKMGLGFLACGLILELVRRLLPEDDFGEWG